MKLYCIVLFLSFAQYLIAQKYDSTFNGNGFVSGATLYEGINEIESPTSILVDAENKIVMLNTFNGAGATILRLTIDGAYDTDFGTDGIAELLIGEDEEFKGVFQNEDGYRLAGYVSPEFAFYSPFIEQISAFGDVNTSFGLDGIVAEYSIDKFIVSASNQGLSGRIFVIGADLVYAIGAGLVVFEEDGTFNSDFGYNTLNIEYFTQYNCVLELPDERILVGGYTYDALHENTIAFVVCFLSNGEIDLTFGVDGFLYPETSLLHDNCRISEFAQSPDGFIYAAGNIKTETAEDIIVIKFNNSGILQTDFGNAGFTFIDGEESVECIEVVASNENEVYVLLKDHPEGDGTDNAKIFKFLSNGLIDSSFTNGVPGMFLIDVPETGSFNETVPTAMTKQIDGKLLITGHTDGLSGNDDFFICRLTPNNLPLIDGVIEVIPNSIALYPNPVDHQFTIQSNTAIQSLSIFSIEGKLITTSQCNTVILNIDVTGYKPGFYTLKICDNIQNYWQHFVVK